MHHQSRILIIGCSGLGAEVAHICRKMGCKHVALVDPSRTTTTSSYDLGESSYCCASAVLKKEEEKEKLMMSHPEQAAMTTVREERVNDDLWTADVLLPLIMDEAPSSPITCVVVTIPLNDGVISIINQNCRKRNVKFIYALVCGLFGRIFCDFGPQHVADLNRPNPTQMRVESIRDGGEFRVLSRGGGYCGGHHRLETGSTIVFSRIPDILLPWMNENTPYEVQVTSPYTFELRGVDFKLEPSEEHDMAITIRRSYMTCTEWKRPVIVSFDTYKEALEKESDDRVLHVAFQALENYRRNHHGEYPTPGNRHQAMEVYESAREICSTAAATISESKDARDLVLQLASGSRAVLAPMCSVLGGIVGHEVIKACTNKCMPIQGFYFVDASDCLPGNLFPETESAPQHSRYNSQIVVFGKAFQQKLMDLSLLLVGAGRLGCGVLENWAAMGVGCGSKGHVYVFDTDRIKETNLVESCLFRQEDIGERKSSVAVKAAQSMNPHLNATAYQEETTDRDESESFLDSDLCDRLDGICTAVDNYEARQYVGEKCVEYRLPMLDSGIDGTMGHVQVVVPHVTEHYAATKDSTEVKYAISTFEYFPSQIEATIQFALHVFEQEFKKKAEEASSYLHQSPEAYLASTDYSILALKEALIDRPATFEDCVKWARDQFEELFHNRICRMLQQYPADKRVPTGSGDLFWDEAGKRCPVPLSFDPNSRCSGVLNHFDFVQAATYLRARIYGIAVPSDEDYFRDVLSTVSVPKSAIAALEAVDAGEEDPERKIAAAWKAVLNLPKSKMIGLELHSIDFDADNDLHVQFITACSNLEALTYNIPTENTHRSRALALRIVPKVATTSALVAGLINLEVYKLVGKQAYKNRFTNLAIPLIVSCEPPPPAATRGVVKGKERLWTVWDSPDINKGDITMGEFIKYFEVEYNLKISMLCYGVKILYTCLHHQERKRMKMSHIIARINNREFPLNQPYIILNAIAKDLITDEEVELPYIRFHFH